MNEDKILEKLEKHDGQLDKLIQKSIEHDGRLDQMLTKVEFRAFADEQATANDAMMVILKRLDEERYFTTERVRRIEEDVAVIKRQLHIV
jgi:hypothetical protein